MQREILRTSLEYLKGIGPKKAALLQKELGLYTYQDLLFFFPFRYEDRTVIHAIKDIHEELPYIQVIGRFSRFQMEGIGQKMRLTAELSDQSGVLRVVWFSGAQYMRQYIKTDQTYLVFGKPSVFKSTLSMIHPELDEYSTGKELHQALVPVYSSSAELKQSKITNKQLLQTIQLLLEVVQSSIPENMPEYLLKEKGLMARNKALTFIHKPPDSTLLAAAQKRLKFEEIFYIQVKALMQRISRQKSFKGHTLYKTTLLKSFYDNYLPFELTDAQKRVIREIFQDLKSGKQMNRLLQGDVGSGKTIVAFCSMLIALSNETQACIMAPTEILAEQHFRSIFALAEPMGIRVALLTGSTKKRTREALHDGLQNGSVSILIGTHALLEDDVQFQNLSLCVIDEQHKFGVAQRARLWKKGNQMPPHILVMTATPIPRTLAMTVYGDLDVSVIDTLPSGRKPIVTVQRFDSDRLKVYDFVRSQLQLGFQAYVIYPLVKESEWMDLKNVEEGHQMLQKVFAAYEVAMVHGRMKPTEKEQEMRRFVSGEVNILVSTTVIEVGVNVPNASVMLIENAERFGLAQLHQLRGRVGRGSDQSYCILMTDYKASSDSRHRIKIMTKTQNGFEIANEDMKLRGPGDLLGTQQSGLPEMKLTNLQTDGALIAEVRTEVEKLLEHDPHLSLPENFPIKQFLETEVRNKGQWSKIS
jgi:ATP-dependent DNA helicase RecG